MSERAPGTAAVQTDADLVVRAANGDHRAFDALYRAYYARVHNFAVRLTGSVDSADDVAQTAFVRAYESLGRLRDGQAFLKFVYRIVLNLVRDQAKAAKRKPWVALQDLFGPVALITRASRARTPAVGAFVEALRSMSKKER